MLTVIDFNLPPLILVIPHCIFTAIQGRDVYSPPPPHYKF